MGVTMACASHLRQLVEEQAAQEGWSQLQVRVRVRVQVLVQPHLSEPPETARDNNK
jgi:hypothetical protein